MAEELRVIQVLMGPYRDRRLTISAADADSAISSHWAVDPFTRTDPDNPPPPLTEQQRTAAYDAACEWANAQWAAAQSTTDEGNTDNPARRRTQRRDMTGDRPGQYATRSS
jgi:hypothetical protein